MEPDVLVVGESLVDVVRSADGTVREHPGGSAANVAVALARLGRPVRLATAYADDVRGALVARHLQQSGVRLAADPRAVTRTSTALADVGPDGSASYAFDVEWALASVDDEPVPLAVHVCSLGAVLQPGAEDVVALVRRLRRTATVTYDVNARPAVTGASADVVARVERVAGLADVVKLSDEDLTTLWPDADEASTVDRLLALGPVAVVVTRGAGGATWTGPGIAVQAPAEAVEVADTIGAGDTFGAALLDALWERGLLGAGRREALRSLGVPEVTAVLAHAARAAAVTVSRPGADPPYRHELEGGGPSAGTLGLEP